MMITAVKNIDYLVFQRAIYEISGLIPEETITEEKYMLSLGNVEPLEVGWDETQKDRTIDQMNDLRNETSSPEKKRLASVAITELQGAQMWAVKAITWKD